MLDRYTEDYTHQCQLTDFNMRPHDGCPGRGYRYYTGQPVFPFNAGLSYSSFTATIMRMGEVAAHDHQSGRLGLLCVTVTNMGPFSASYSAMLFATPPPEHLAATPQLLRRKLINFEGVRLAVGQTQRIYFDVSAVQLSVVSPSTGQRISLCGTWELSLGSGGNQSAGSDDAPAVTAPFHVTCTPSHIRVKTDDQLKTARSTVVRVSNHREHDLSPTLYGMFMEELNFVGDGGLFAEQVMLTMITMIYIIYIYGSTQ